MECAYTCLNHNSLVSQKSGHQRCDYKGGLLCNNKFGNSMPYN
jgi:hypothetical protein